LTPPEWSGAQTKGTAKFQHRNSVVVQQHGKVPQVDTDTGIIFADWPMVKTLTISHKWRPEADEVEWDISHIPAPCVHPN